MKLRRVKFDRYVGSDLKQVFEWPAWDIDLDPATLLIRLTAKGHEGIVLVSLLVTAHSADMYPMPEEKAVEPGPARPLPGRPRQRA